MQREQELRDASSESEREDLRRPYRLQNQVIADAVAQIMALPPGPGVRGSMPPASSAAPKEKKEVPLSGNQEKGVRNKADKKEPRATANASFDDGEVDQPGNEEITKSKAKEQDG
jgi:hypothetical protein